MTITRTRVMLRTRYGWPQGAVEFNRNLRHEPDGYRQDMPGFISMCWGLPTIGPGTYGGYDTVTLEAQGLIEEIQPRDLKEGDAIGLCGPGSVDMHGGTLLLFEQWSKPGIEAVCWDMNPDYSPGPVRRTVPFGPQWHCYRYLGIID